MPIFLYLVLFCLISKPRASQDVCIDELGQRITGAVDCSGGEIHLNTTFVDLGIHNVGSFGTASNFTSSYFCSQLGIIADYNRDGFDGPAQPAFAGDYIISSAGLEGDL